MPKLRFQQLEEKSLDESTALNDSHCHDSSGQNVYLKPGRHKKFKPNSDEHKQLARKSVQFQGGVDIFYFQRAQGFGCVPTTGGCTLGMQSKHYAQRRVSLRQHQQEIKSYREDLLRRELLADDFQTGGVLSNVARQKFDDAGKVVPKTVHRFSEEKRVIGPLDCSSENDLEDSGIFQSPFSVNSSHLIDKVSDSGSSVGQNSQETNNYDSSNFLRQSPTHRRLETANAFSNEDFSDDSQISLPEDYYVQPLTPKERRQLLKTSGVTGIDKTERFSCLRIRSSRKKCGCDCPGGICDSLTCPCALSDIKCQVDSESYPCSCTRQTCYNAWGHIEFDTTRVQTHYFATMMRLKAEQQQSQSSKFNGHFNHQTQMLSPMHTRFSDHYSTDRDRKQRCTSSQKSTSTSSLAEQHLSASTSLNLSSSGSGSGLLRQESLNIPAASICSTILA